MPGYSSLPEYRLFIEGMKDDLKREYADAYGAWLLSGRNGPEPDRGFLSDLAAMMVRVAVEGVVEVPAS